MDNITHTLVGLALADSGLKRRSRLGTAALLIGANLPDVDALVYFLGRGGAAGLAFRRGWTHGVLAMALLPVALTAGLLAWDRIVRGAGRAEPESELRPGALLLLAGFGVWSHPLLDLLNTYGVRLLMPFSGRWFYGDALFILDPWVWLALVAGIAIGRARGPDPSRAGRPARVALLLCAGYALAMAVSSRVAQGIVERQAGPGGVRRTLVAPVFATPFRREVIRDLGDRYEIGSLVLGSRPKYTRLEVRLIGAGEPGVRAASATPEGRRFLIWSRFPEFVSTRQGDSIRVAMSDARYAEPGGGSWAGVSVTVPAGQ
jgi:inner membrane protein